ncbi:uncharacterized protein MELLADRAFT_116962 [Melampsora larici-populina 98AG31]|uniref:DUF962-domain-containing protein n=1 Tax=Melampsora larici-populina (strain 98AG31 / pathotype 3-4-7) TaxID=747676 RepID=F4RRU1_MELLP|nr:uncharacterized protein MELLADRAFT_116962 [Melampsora larici-populina 98AG31]EGG04895.1 hypothetical protein MELLADRAFT_116962 [Melampsora larici-populina 98AG31]
MSNDTKPIDKRKPTQSEIEDESLAGQKSSFTLFDLEHQFAFYGQYHVNQVNVAIHIICVPIIFFTALILVHYLPFFKNTILDSQPIHLPDFILATGLYGSDSVYELNLATLVSIGYATYFIILDPIAGTLYAPILLSFGQWSNQLYQLEIITINSSNPISVYSISLITFILGWISQFIGHGKFEGRAPALIDNLLQSIVLAVFFVFIELLFLLGYRTSFQKRLKIRIDKALLEFRKSKVPKP